MAEKGPGSWRATTEGFPTSPHLRRHLGLFPEYRKCCPKSDTFVILLSFPTRKVLLLPFMDRETEAQSRSLVSIA